MRYKWLPHTGRAQCVVGGVGEPKHWPRGVDGITTTLRSLGGRHEVNNDQLLDMKRNVVSNSWLGRRRIREDLRIYFFSNRVFDKWNKLHKETAYAESIMIFRGLFDRDGDFYFGTVSLPLAWKPYWNRSFSLSVWNSSSAAGVGRQCNPGEHKSP